MIDAAEIDRRFDLHTPTDAATGEKLDHLRSLYKSLAEAVTRDTPVGREQSLAVTALEESLYWTVGSIVRPTPESHH